MSTSNPGKISYRHKSVFSSVPCYIILLLINNLRTHPNIPISFVMSVTTLANPVTTSLHRALAAYDLHLSADEYSTPPPDDPNVNRTISPSTTNTPDWVTTFRRVPHYRPINHNLSSSQRPLGQNPMEVVFVWTMMHGNWIQAVNLSAAYTASHHV